MSQQIFCKNLNETQNMAVSAAISQGYDQIIYRKPKKGYSFVRSTNRISPRKIICYIRLTYRDGVLGTMTCER